ncbi:transcription initiation factor IIA subunit 1 isoform X1 [Anopheles cruzii]|uniref:transcription initiation factor IIA subunit 1 isoform X1 n=1 Tax=Anopheles cruzii TaxID=68878 RepID=UPI0022EC989B|nr:transcription initiation factor IIA subunit 1 isoform X1 [Anopheles cruzii]
MMALSQTSVLKVYQTVIDDVIGGVRDAFLDEGVDEQVLQELKQIWTSKVLANKAVEVGPEAQDQQLPPILGGAKSVSHSKANGTKKAKAAAAAAAASSSTNQENGKVANSGTAASNNVKSVPIKPEPAESMTGSNRTTTASTTGAQQQSSGAVPSTVVAALDPNKLVAIQITLPAQPNVPNSQPRVLTIQVPASALQENQLQQVLTSPIISSIMPLPPQIASSVLQQHVNSYLQSSSMNKHTLPIQKQLDGACDDDPMGESYSPSDSPIIQTNSELCAQSSRPVLFEWQLLSTPSTNGDGSKKSDSETMVATSSSTAKPVGGKNVRRRLSRAGRKAASASAAHDEVIIRICQLDGAVDTSDEEASDISDDNIPDDDDEDLDKEEEDDLDAEGGAEEEPLNSEDDVTDEDASDLFETDNVVVCQYDKITRSRNKWKFYLKDGIMHVNGKDFVFQKSNGDAEW